MHSIRVVIFRGRASALAISQLEAHLARIQEAKVNAQFANKWMYFWQRKLLHAWAILVLYSIRVVIFSVCVEMFGICVVFFVN